MVAPAITTSESQVVPTRLTLGTTLPVVVGGATRGPTVPTKVRGEQELIRNFGFPVSSDYGLLAAVEFFKEGEELWFLRVVDGTELAATAEVPGPEGVAATGTVTLTGLPIDADNVIISDGTTAVTFEFDLATAATGNLNFTGLPTDGDVFTLNDGTNATTFEYDTAAAATGELILGGQPNDGDTWRIGDGTQTVDFEFDNNASVVESNVLRQVVIGATLNDTLTNLLNAVNNVAFPFNITAGNLQADRIDLTHDSLGVIGNVPIVEQVNVSTNLSSTGMAGGDDLVAAGANVPIQIGADATATAVNARAAINGVTALGITAGTGSTADDVSLTNNAAGTAGNVAISETVDNMTATGMAGGANAGVGGGNVAVQVGVTALATAQNLLGAINLQSFSVTATLDASNPLQPIIRLTNTPSVGATGNVTITEVDTNGVIAVVGMAGGTDPGSTVGITFSSAFPGSWYNDVRVTVAPTIVAGAPAGAFDLTVEIPIDTSGTLQVAEQFFNLSADSAAERFVETVLANGLFQVANPSRYVRASVAVNQQPVSGVYQLGATQSGTDGFGALTAPNYIGTLTGTATTGMQQLLNAETVDFNVIALPGVTDAAVLLEALRIARTRKDAIVIVDSPFGLTHEQVVDWHNGISSLVPNAPTSALDDSFGFLAWPWARLPSSYLNTNIYLPPSAGLLPILARTDSQASPARAPAGQQRGVWSDVIDLETSPSAPQRDLLLGGSNAVNPFIIDGGRVVFYGNETLARGASVFNAIQVRRLAIDLRKRTVDAVRNFQFEPADGVTVEQVKLAVDSVLIFLAGRRDIKPINDDGTRPRSVVFVDPLVPKTVQVQVFVSHIDASEIIPIEFVFQASAVA